MVILNRIVIEHIKPTNGLIAPHWIATMTSRRNDPVCDIKFEGTGRNPGEALDDLLRELLGNAFKTYQQ